MRTELQRLYDQDNKKAYQSLLELEGISADSDELYCLLPEFIQMLDQDTTYLRVRGVRMICAQARWDKDKVIEQNLAHILSELDDEKPTAVRQCLAAMHNLILYRPELSEAVAAKLHQLNLSQYKDTMQPLLKKDVDELLKMC